MSEAVATERVGRYQLLEPLGAGPTGVVSRAKVFGVAGFERQFAIKRFLPEVASSTGAQALSAAARAYGGLEHPRIARMAEFGVSQGTTFTAVELVPGIDALRLATEARNNGMALASGGVLALVSQAARAIGYAHGRGISHLGLAPTNVIVTPDGDVKITDFAVLAATLPQRPVDSARLSQRIAYLAPEQIAGEATSAATDVFALGVLAHELVAGQRAFQGDSPAQIAQAIVAGPPPELQLPRPIVRVLQRCLARSPFERFPDARALADALDAALRVAPIPGSRKDVGAIVKEIVERLAVLNEGAMSGMLNLNPGTGPVPRIDPQAAADVPTDAYLYPVGTAEAEKRMSGLGPESTQPDLPRPISTVPGLAPPPIPVPSGIHTPPPIPAAKPPGSNTILGAPPPQMQIPQIPPVIRPRTSPSSLPSVPKPGSTPPPVRVPQLTPPPVPVVGSAKKSQPGIPGAVPPPRPPSAPPAVPPPVPSQVLVAPPPAPTFGGHSLDDTVPAPLQPAMTEDGVSVPNALTPTPLTSVPPLRDSPLTIPRVGTPLDQAIPEDLPTREHVKPDEALLRASRPSSPPSRAPRVSEASPVLFPERHTEPGMGRPSPSTLMGIATPEPLPPPPPMVGRTSTPRPKDIVTTDMSPVLADGLAAATRHPTGDIDQLVEDAHHADAMAEFPDEKHSEGAVPLEMLSHNSAVIRNTPPALRLETIESLSKPLPVPPPANDGASVARPTKKGSKAPIIVVGALVVLAAGGVAAWQTGLLDGVIGGGSGDDVVTRPAAVDGAVVATGTDAASTAPDADKATTPPDATVVATVVDAGKGTDARTADAGAADAGAADAAVVAAKDAGPADASVAVAPPDAAIVVTPGDGLAINSTPAGARVYLDGSDQGVTPAKLAATGDHHTVALILAAHELYVGQITGKGKFDVALKAVTPSSGPAGIKVIKCKDKDRYYVFVDGKPSGMTCPTERIECALGAHTVEVYDAQTDSRKKWDINITDTEHSFRVRIEP